MAADPVRDRVADELARLRAMAGIGGRAMATKVGVSQPTISRIERAERLPTVPQTRAWLDAVAAPPEVRATLLDLVEAAHSETVAYRRAVRERPQQHLQTHVADLESRCVRLRAWEPFLVHGLLQEPDYARGAMRLADFDSAFDHEAALEARLQRQQALLDDPSRSLSIVMAEAVLRSPIMTGSQARHLADLATTVSHLTVGVVPSDAAWPTLPFNEFNLYDLRTETDSAADQHDQLVAIELTHGESTVTGEEDVVLYERVHQAWLDVALSGDAAAELILRASVAD